jgi:hypothetical protein
MSLTNGLFFPRPVETASTRLQTFIKRLWREAGGKEIQIKGQHDSSGDNKKYFWKWIIALVKCQQNIKTGIMLRVKNKVTAKLNYAVFDPTPIYPYL